MKLPGLVWKEWNKKHILKHGVTTKEVEEAYNLSQVAAEGKNGRTYVISKIQNGRMITVFLSFEQQKRPFVVSARDASAKERKIYYEKFL